jgi:hypothetical protein
MRHARTSGQSIQHKSLLLEEGRRLRRTQIPSVDRRQRDYYNQYNEVDEAEAGLPMIDGVRALRQSLTELDEGSVVILAIG